MQIKGIKVEWTQTFEHHCIYTQNFYVLFSKHSTNLCQGLRSFSSIFPGFLHFLSKHVRIDRAIFVLFVWWICNFRTIASTSQYDSCHHDNMAQTLAKFFYIDSLTSFCLYECEKSIFD